MHVLARSIASCTHAGCRARTQGLHAHNPDPRQQPLCSLATTMTNPSSCTFRGAMMPELTLNDYQQAHRGMAAQPG
jgi:hypothetical protein